MSAVENPGFVRLVLDRGLADEREVRRAMGAGRDATVLLRHLLAAGRLPRRECMMLWGEGFGCTWIELRLTLVDRSVLLLLPRELAEKHRIMLIYRMGEKITAVAADPADHAMVAKVSALVKAPISVVVALPEVIAEAIQLNYPAIEDFEVIESLAHREFKAESRKGHENEVSAAGKSIVMLADALLALAVKDGASDIHLEPRETFAQVRFRVDGVLHDRTTLSLAVHERLVSRIKVVAGMDITERRRPQDGRLALDLPTRKLEFRCSAVPALHGEKLVLRCLTKPTAQDVPALTELDLGMENLENLRALLSGRTGVLLVVGPTGSGKTTTLFSALGSLDRAALNIVTVEEPVEYVLPGVTQVAVNRAIDMGFAEVLRSFMRQDPDVMLIGEIRDRESVGIAFEAALTGHLVFASLHANNAVQAVTRLRQLGADAGTLGSSLLGIVSQRLLPRICPACRTAWRPSREELQRHFAFEGDPEVHFHRGEGCEQCNHTGYRGRVAIHELLVIDAELQALLAEGASTATIAEAALRGGFKPLRYDGLKKVLRGLTTIEELDKAVAA